MTMTASVITPYTQQESYETGRYIARTDRSNGLTYGPPPNSDAAMLQGYDYEWALWDLIESDQPATDEESRFEDEQIYLDLMGKW